ncbi:ADP-heptose:LPS heptosyltransferase [Pseudarcicella hirudinis]|uniref:ADP-heptose:LPS heptosyltransferase n=1 Tax=Pseudarcicella hirudinis TaxID=1079859 RepID=A0A1I5WZS6_9BACT|nr:glycosyltransferase family 9 protein [Pseudarcicella hirudinis]SFQ25253.1 ADP-heptose:LPS heptosyltransferase [Pseudarcicella hirudinis]
MTRIIISRTDSIGDVVLTLPLAGLLKKLYPSSEIFFLGSNYTRAIVETSQHITGFISWDSLKELSEPGAISFLEKLNLDTIIHAFPNRKIAKIAFKAKIPLRIGTSHRWFHWIYCNKLPNFSRKNSNLHEAQLNLKLAEPLGAASDYPLTEIIDLYGLNNITSLPEIWKDQIDTDRINVILHPKSKGSAREWGLERFGELIKILPEEKFKIFVSGTAQEGELLKDWIQQFPSVHNLTGKLSLSEFIAFIASSDALVAASTGPVHIAAALGKRAIGIYPPMRPIHPGRWKPLGKNALFLALDKNCEDCKKTQNCECMRMIQANQVKKLLNI